MATPIPPASAPPTLVQHKYITYTVQSGDAMLALARRYQQPLSALARSNKARVSNLDLIYPGQVLIIPQAPGYVIEPVAGDTIETLAKQHGLSTDMIIAEASNQLTRSDQALQPGQLLFVPEVDGLAHVMAWPAPALEPASGAGGSVAITPTLPVTNPPPGGAAFIHPTQDKSVSGFDLIETHSGLDFAGRRGSPAFAAAKGTVVACDYAFDTDMKRLQGWGLFVELDHGNGFRTVYAHLEQCGVAKDQIVEQGQIIGAIGSSGDATGPHLHFEIHRNGKPENPRLYLAVP
jgi:murein DD-endopeptidase MepM/ murein hydrolase activator NlpD